MVLREGDASFVVPPPQTRPRPLRSPARAAISTRVSPTSSRAPITLLFVLGLLLLVRGPAAIVRTITAFTLAHHPARPRRHGRRAPPARARRGRHRPQSGALLASSRLARPGSATPTPARCKPALMAFAFGLLHGFGVRWWARRAACPPNRSRPRPRRLQPRWRLDSSPSSRWRLALPPSIHRALRPALVTRLARVPAYVIGSLGALFVCERVAAFWRS